MTIVAALLTLLTTAGPAALAAPVEMAATNEPAREASQALFMDPGLRRDDS